MDADQLGPVDSRIIAASLDDPPVFGMLFDRHQHEGVTSILPNDGSDPVATCAALWAAGGMVPAVHDAPDLVACVRNTHVEVREGSTAEDCLSYETVRVIGVSATVTFACSPEDGC